ncbi:MAG: DUF885 domain-containing protein [Chitinophagales bacterium]|nr:DUF885 domain-containing protein [Chitinophagales bacterium]MDW8420016.1 DUF885 domain-containing protein [Chitinophagales bacterium]
MKKNSACPPETIAAESQKVNAYLDRKFDEAVARNPEWASHLGYKIRYDEWSDRSDENYKRELAIAKASLDSLEKSFSLDCLDEQTALSVQLFREDVKRMEEGYRWRHHYYEITQLGGVHNDIPSFLINIHRIDTLTDAFAYLSRVRKIKDVIDQTLTNLKTCEKSDVFPPHFTFKYVTEDIRAFMKGCESPDEDNILLQDFSHKLKALQIAESQKEEMIKQLAHTLRTDVKDAYSRLLDYWLTLEKKAAVRDNKGVWSLPEGEAFYAFQIRQHTTTDYSPEEVYAMGEREVARIQEEMREIIRKVKFASDSLADFLSYVRTDPQFKYTNDEKGRKQLLSDVQRYIDGMRKELPRIFNQMPKAALEVKEVEAFRAKSAGGAFYEQPSVDGTRPGRFYVNTYDMNTEPKYQMEALSYHEAVPGHHLQIALAQELENLPKFRKHSGFTAYVEGWALYAEKLGKELGKYEDPYSDFGRLSMELFRAARLVVDVGIHHKRWTREQAIAYMTRNTANAPGDVEREVERYFLWPGQALGYKVGMMKILALREKARQQLGNKFDIKKFHDAVLTQGAVPLTTLEKLVDKMIEESK